MVEALLEATKEFELDHPIGGAFAGLPITMAPRKNAPDMPLGTHIIVAGKPKTGKSTSTQDARKVLYLDFERRLEYIDVPRISPIYYPNGVKPVGAEYPFDTILSEVKKGKKLEFLRDWLIKIGSLVKADGGTNIQTINFDTMDTLASLAAQAHQDDRALTFMPIQEYKTVYSAILPIVERYRRLPVDVIFQCHVEEMNVNNKQQVWLSLYPFLREWITSHVDMILYLYQPQQGQLNRFYCHNKDGWPSGDGTGKLPETLPATMSAVYECFRGGDPEQWQPRVDVWQTESIPAPFVPEKRKRAKKE